MKAGEGSLGGEKALFGLPENYNSVFNLFHVFGGPVTFSGNTGRARARARYAIGRNGMIDWETTWYHAQYTLLSKLHSHTHNIFVILQHMCTVVTLCPLNIL